MQFIAAILAVIASVSAVANTPSATFDYDGCTPLCQSYTPAKKYIAGVSKGLLVSCSPSPVSGVAVVTCQLSCPALTGTFVATAQVGYTVSGSFVQTGAYGGVGSGSSTAQVSFVADSNTPALNLAVAADSVVCTPLAVSY